MVNHHIVIIKWRLSWIYYDHLRKHDEILVIAKATCRGSTKRFNMRLQWWLCIQQVPFPPNCRANLWQKPWAAVLQFLRLLLRSVVQVLQAVQQWVELPWNIWRFQWHSARVGDAHAMDLGLRSP